MIGTRMTRNQRRATISRYLAARTAFDTYTTRWETDRDAGLPVPRTEATDLTYQQLNTEFADACAAAPWWARLIWP